MRTKAVSVRLDFEIIAVMDAVARRQGQTRSEALRQAVEEWVRERAGDGAILEAALRVTSDVAREESRRSA